MILVSCDSYECPFSENQWCRRVGGVHYVELTPYVQQHKRQWGMPFFAVCQLGNPLIDFQKKIAQLIRTSTSAHVQMLGSVSSKGACLRMREVVAVRRLFF